MTANTYLMKSSCHQQEGCSLYIPPDMHGQILTLSTILNFCFVPFLSTDIATDILKAIIMNQKADLFSQLLRLLISRKRKNLICWVANCGR